MASLLTAIVPLAVLWLMLDRMAKPGAPTVAAKPISPVAAARERDSTSTRAKEPQTDERRKLLELERPEAGSEAGVGSTATVAGPPDQVPAPPSSRAYALHTAEAARDCRLKLQFASFAPKCVVGGAKALPAVSPVIPGQTPFVAFAMGI